VLDLIIRGGDLVDGTGALVAAPMSASQGDRVVAIGQLDTDAASVIDATAKW